MRATDLFVWGLVAHLVCDWLLQNHWMASRKWSLRDAAAWVHGGIHFLGLLLVFPPAWALAVALSHLLIDTRIPLTLWGVLIGQTSHEQNAEVHLHLAFWRDQVAHIALLALAARLAGV